MFDHDGPSFVELVRQALSSTERGYDLLAPKFERTPFRTPDAVLERMAGAIGGAESVDDALDVMCGTGAVLRWVRPLCRRRVVGIDFSAGMLAEAERRLASAADRRAPARVDFVRGDVLAMTYDREFDLVTSAGAFGHIAEDEEPRLLANVHRALRPGGRFVFPTTPMPPFTSPGLWMARAFNAAMHVRNALWAPPFVMYYLTMLWPEVGAKLERAGFTVEAKTALFPAPFTHAVLVVATRPG